MTRKSNKKKSSKAKTRAVKKASTRSKEPSKARSPRKTDAEKKQTAKEKRAAERADIIEKGPESPYWRQWLRSHLRASFRKWPSFQHLSATAPRKKLVGLSKRGLRMMLWHKQCTVCGNWFQTRDLAQDHITPAGSLLTTEPEEVGRFVLNLFCAGKGLRYVCDYTLADAEERFDGRKSCHWEITHGKKLER